MDPLADPQLDCATTNSAFTPPLTVIDGTFPHLGEIVAGTKSAQVSLGSPHACHSSEIFTTSPQL